MAAAVAAGMASSVAARMAGSSLGSPAVRAGGLALLSARAFALRGLAGRFRDRFAR